MARPPNRNMTDIADAKEHLRELGRKDSASVFGVSLAQAGTLLAVGGLLGRMLAARRKDPISIPLRDLVLRVGMTVAPLLIQQLIGCRSRRTQTTPGEEDKATAD